RADRFVRVRHAEEESWMRSVADGQELDRATLGRAADGLQPRECGMFLDERPGARAELLQSQKLARIRDAPEKRREVLHVVARRAPSTSSRGCGGRRSSG